MDCFPEFTHILINEILKIRNILNIILVGLVTRTEVSNKLNTRGTVLTHRKQVQEAQRDEERESFATVLFSLLFHCFLCYLHSRAGSLDVMAEKIIYHLYSLY